MAPRSDLIAAANASFIGSYRKLCEHADGVVAEFGRVFAFATGLPVSIFNGCVVIEQSDESDLVAAVDWTERMGHPFRVWIAEGLAGGLGDSLSARGLVRDEEPFPGMVLHPVPEPPKPAPGVEVSAVRSPAALADHVGVQVAGGVPPDVARRLIPTGMADDPDVTPFTGHLQGRPVGVSLAIRTGSVGGVYGVATLADARRRGVGAATTWAAVAAARSWGMDTVVLQASEMGFPLYRAMGFRTVIDYAVFRQADPPTGGS